MGENISPVSKFTSDNSEEGTTNENTQTNSDNSNEPDSGKVDKFANKTIEQVIESYGHAENKITSQGEEIARLADMNKKVIEAFSTKVNPAKEPEKKMTKEQLSDLMTADPNKAAETIMTMFSKLDQKVASSETSRINDNEKARETIKFNKAQSKLKEDHADFNDVVSSQSFKEWVQGNVSPDLAKMADDGEKGGNPEVMSLVIGNYKRSLGDNGGNKTKTKLPPNIKSSSMKSSGNAPLFTRDQLRKMPKAEYASRNDEIVRAYAEGRVS